MKVFVPLTKSEFDALRELAREERRRPQDQAAVLLGRILAAGRVSAEPAEVTASSEAGSAGTREADDGRS